MPNRSGEPRGHLSRRRLLGRSSALLRRTLRVSLVVAGVLGILAAVSWMFRRPITNALLFHPERGQSRDPGDLGLAYEALRLTAEDGIRTEAWWLPGDGDGPIIVFFHGNAGTMADRLENARALVDLGASVLMSEYRGYGDSEGQPSERGLYADAAAAMREARRRAAGRKVIAFGRSLGGAVAIDAAARLAPDALVIESTFTNLPDMARSVVKIPGAGLLAAYRFESRAKIRSLRMPVLVIHGDADELVPFWMGEALARAAPHGQLHRVRGGTHNDTWIAGGSGYWRAWTDLFERVR